MKSNDFDLVLEIVNHSNIKWINNRSPYIL